MPISVVESSVRSRQGDPETSSDVVLITPKLVALVSGVARNLDPKTIHNGVPPARYVATNGAASLRTIDPERPLSESIAFLTRDIQHALERAGFQKAHAGYAFAAVNSARREIWRVGAMHVLRDSQDAYVNSGMPESLTLVAQARTLILHALTSHKSGKYTAEQVLASDPSKPLLAPLLAAHDTLANSDGPLGYALINGQAIQSNHLFTSHLLPGNREVVLASMGYPHPRGTLASSEKILKELMDEDPLLIHRYPFIRSTRPGHESYADRAYLRVRVW